MICLLRSGGMNGILLPREMMIHHLPRGIMPTLLLGPILLDQRPLPLGVGDGLGRNPQAVLRLLGLLLLLLAFFVLVDHPLVILLHLILGQPVSAQGQLGVFDTVLEAGVLLALLPRGLGDDGAFAIHQDHGTLGVVGAAYVDLFDLQTGIARPRIIAWPAVGIPPHLQEGGDLLLVGPLRAHFDAAAFSYHLM